MTDDVAKLRHHRELGVRLLIDFIEATPETAAGLVERESAWARDLIPLVEPFGDGVAARFEPLSPMLANELSMVAHCAPLDDTAQEARYCHAVRMSRLDELFKQFPPVLPKGKGGRRKYDDDTIVDKARAFWKSSGTGSKVEAAREAMARFPGLYEGSGKTLSIAKRIAKKM